MSFSIDDLPHVSVGIITALAKEKAAMKAVLGNGNEVVAKGKGGGRRYWLAEVPGAHNGNHVVAITQLASIGTNVGALYASALAQRCINAHFIFMVGIAGGVPNPKKPSDHVRLGDIVVSDAMGVVQYDYVKRTNKFAKPRYLPRPPGVEIIETLNALEEAELEGHCPWNDYIDIALQRLKWTRPNPDTDILKTSDGRKVIAHPDDEDRVPGFPRVFHGPIASANTLLKDARYRDHLRDAFGVKAIEMEGSGIADAAWFHENSYLVVRGTCDYCDAVKNDKWQKYASVIAASYTRALLEALPCSRPSVDPHQGHNTQHRDALGILIAEVVRSWTREGRMFSAYVVSREVQRLARGHHIPWTRHLIMGNAVHEALLSKLRDGSYVSTLQQIVGAPRPAYVYHPRGTNCIGYPRFDSSKLPVESAPVARRQR